MLNESLLNMNWQQRILHIGGKFLIQRRKQMKQLQMKKMKSRFLIEAF